MTDLTTKDGRKAAAEAARNEFNAAIDAADLAYNGAIARGDDEATATRVHEAATAAAWDRNTAARRERMAAAGHGGLPEPPDPDSYAD